MPQALNRRRRSNGSSGFSLVEVIVAMLITCVMVTAVMGVAVTAKQGSIKTTHREMFDQGIAQLSAELKQYVTACGCNKGTGICPAPACSTLLGPNSNRPGVASWYFNGAVGPTGTIADNRGDVWALACGNHRLTGVLTGGAPNLEAAPYNGSITYNVSYPIGGCAGIPTVTDTPLVQFTASWTEP